MSKTEAVAKLEELGAQLMKAEDSHGETKSGWWMDGVWLAPKNDPKEALRALRGE